MVGQYAGFYRSGLLGEEVYSMSVTQDMCLMCDTWGSERKIEEYHTHVT